MTVKGYRAASPYVVAVLSLAYLLAIVDRMVLSLLIDPIKADLHVTDTEIGLLAGLAFGLFYTVLGIPLGRLADRMHRPLLISSGLILWSLATMACGLTANFAQLLMARFSVGVGEATISPASYSLIADYVPKSKLGRALSVYMLGTPIGLGLAWILGGQVIHWLNALGPLDFRLIRTLAPWQTVFMAAGLPGLLVAPFVMLITEPRKHGGRTSCDPVPLDRGSHEPAPPSTAFDFASVWNQLRSAKAVYLSHFLGIGAVNTYGFALVTWAPAMFHREFGWSIERTGLVLGFGIMLTGIVAMLASGHVIDYLTRKGAGDAPFRVLFLGTLLMVPIGILGPLTATGWLRAVLFIFPTMGLFFAVVACAPVALQMATPPSMRGSISAIYLFVVNMFAYALGPVSVGFVSDHLLSSRSKMALALSVIATIGLPLGAIAFRSGVAPFQRLVHPAS